MAFQKADTRGLITGNATQAAATVYAGLGRDTFDVDEFEEIRTAILNGSLALQGAEGVIESMSDREETPRRSSGGSNYRKSSNGNDPLTLEIRAGKYAGKTIGHVLDVDVDYAEWFAENGKNEFLAKKFAEALAA